MSKAVDDGSEGTLSWAIAEARTIPGHRIIEFAPGLSILVEEGYDLPGNVTLRSQDPASPAEIVSDTGGSGALEFVDPESGPVAIEAINFRPDADSSARSAGVIVGDTVCSLRLSQTRFEGFQAESLQVYGTPELKAVEVIDSVFSDNQLDTALGNSAMYIRGERLNAHISVINSSFRNNGGTALNLEGLFGEPGRPQGRLSIVGSEFTGHKTHDETFESAIQVDTVMELDGFERTEPYVSVLDSVFSENIGPVAGGLTVENIHLESVGESSVPLVSVSGSSFLNNESTMEPSHANDIYLDWIKHSDDLDPGTVLAVTNSTFLSPGTDDAASVLLGTLAGEFSFDHVTFVGSGISVSDWDKRAAGRIAVSNTVFSTGAREPIFEIDSSEVLSPDAVLESHAAYTTPPTGLPAGPGRVVSDASAFALGELRDDLGATPVFLPGGESVLIDAGAAGGPPADQRGLSRPQGAAPDIGAVEAEYVAPPATEPSLVSVGDDQVVNSGEPLKFTVSRADAAEAALTGEATVVVTTHDGSAKAGTDYTRTSEVLRWGPGDSADKTIEVSTYPVAAGELPLRNTMTLVLSDPGTNTLLGDRASATGTIVTDRKAPVVDPLTDPSEPTALPNPDGGQGLAASGDGEGLLVWGIGGLTIIAAGAGVMLARRKLGSAQ